MNFLQYRRLRFRSVIAVGRSLLRPSLASVGSVHDKCSRRASTYVRMRDGRRRIDGGRNARTTFVPSARRSFVRSSVTDRPTYSTFVAHGNMHSPSAGSLRHFAMSYVPETPLPCISFSILTSECRLLSDHPSGHAGERNLDYVSFN